MLYDLLIQKKLHALSMESESLSSEIAQRKELLEKIEAEDRVVTKVREEINIMHSELSLVFHL